MLIESTISHRMGSNSAKTAAVSMCGRASGLEDRSRAPHHPRRGITQGQRWQALRLKAAAALVGRFQNEARPLAFSVGEGAAGDLA
jgi:hypothetical protein